MPRGIYGRAGSEWAALLDSKKRPFAGKRSARCDSSVVRAAVTPRLAAARPADGVGADVPLHALWRFENAQSVDPAVVPAFVAASHESGNCR